MIKKIYDKILVHSKLDEIVNFKLKNNTFEEFPIISRYKSIDFFQQYIKKEDYSACLLNISLFLLYNIKIQFKNSHNKEEYEDYFACITLCDADTEVNDVGFTVPSIFISRKSNVTYLSQQIIFNLKNDLLLNKLFGSMIDDSMFDCYKTVTKNDYEDVSRVYIIPKRW